MLWLCVVFPTSSFIDTCSSLHSPHQIGSFYGQPSFLKRFGTIAPSSPNGYVIPAQWQSALNNGSSAGGILGLMLNGWAAERFGAKKVMLTALFGLIGFIFIMVFADSLTMLVIGEVFCGIPWGESISLLPLHS